MAGSYLYKDPEAKYDYIADVFDTLIVRDGLCKDLRKVSFSKVFLNGCYLDGCGLKIFLILTAHLCGRIRYT